jgi:hypothetical protein
MTEIMPGAFGGQVYLFGPKTNDYASTLHIVQKCLFLAQNHQYKKRPSSKKVGANLFRFSMLFSCENRWASGRKIFFQLGIQFTGVWGEYTCVLDSTLAFWTVHLCSGRSVSMSREQSATITLTTWPTLCPMVSVHSNHPLISWTSGRRLIFFTWIVAILMGFGTVYNSRQYD